MMAQKFEEELERIIRRKSRQRELVLGLLEVLTTSKHECIMPTLVDMGNPGSRVHTTARLRRYGH